MTQHKTSSKLTQVAAILAASIALIVTTNIASAHSHHDSGPTSNSRPNNWKEKNLKESSHKESNHKSKTDKSTNKKTCLYITADGKRCGQTSDKTKKGDTTQTANKGNVTTSTNNGKSTSTPSQATSSTTTKSGPSSAFTTVTITNGVLNSAIFNGKGITVKANPNNTITISNGNSSVTLPGGSITLHGALTVSGGPDVQIAARNGDVIVAANPTPAPKPIGTNNPPPGVTFGDDVKAVGKVAGNTAATIVASPVIVGTAAGIELGSVIVGTAAGHPIQYAKDTYNELVNDIGSATEWVSSLF